MSSEEEMLFKFLESLGLKGAILEEDVTRYIKSNASSFSVRHRIGFGSEMMLYDLHFLRDPQFQAFRLERFKATHRSEPLITHKVINGVDTYSVEEKMKAIAPVLFSDSGYRNLDKNPADQKLFREATHLLHTLAGGKDPEGVSLRNLLIYKYWPEFMLDKDTLRELQRQYEKGRDFIPTELGYVNTNLAFYIVSGRFDRLLEQLMASGIESFPGAGLYGTIEKALSEDQDHFEITSWYSTPAGYVDFSIPVDRKDGEYEAESLVLTIRQYPNVTHGIYDGIDTAGLDLTMRAIDWQDDRTFYVSKPGEDPDWKEEIMDIRVQMDQLFQDPEGAKVAALLALHYWPGVVDFNDMVTEEAWDLLDNLPKTRHELPLEYGTRLAFNLISGRPVIEDQVFPGVLPSSTWLKFSASPEAAGDFEVVPGALSRKDIAALMELIPLAKRSQHDIELLTRGEQLTRALVNGTSIRIEANPPESTLNIFGADGRRIPVNLRFDPDWKDAEISSDNNNSIVQEEKRNTIPVKPRRFPKRGI